MVVHKVVTTLAVLVACFTIITQFAIFIGQVQPATVSVGPLLLDETSDEGTVQILVRLNTDFPGLTSPHNIYRVKLQRRLINAIQDEIEKTMTDIPGSEVVHSYRNLPLMTVLVTPEALAQLKDLGGLIRRIDAQCLFADASLCRPY